MECIVVLLTAFVLDVLLGDPRKLPHLIVGYGNLIAYLEKKLNKGNHKLFKGFVTVLFCIATVLVVYMCIDFLLHDYLLMNIFVSIVLLFYCLANTTLVREGKAVFFELEHKGLEAGRKRLSWIVGRDTKELTEQQIKKATFETMAENLSDGVIAPMFYFVCFGVAGALVYKMINTLDSMIGYKNERYEQFGKFAAKLDDVANYIPARLTAILMLMVTCKLKGLRFVFQQGKNHSSPNAGYPEAALAYILSCQFGGPNSYFGKLVHKPFIGTNTRRLDFNEINKVAAINYKTSILFLMLGIVYFCIQHVYN